MRIAQYLNCGISELIELGVPKLKEIYNYLVELLDELETRGCIEDEEYLMWELEQLNEQNPKGNSQSWDL